MLEKDILGTIKIVKLKQGTEIVGALTPFYTYTIDYSGDDTNFKLIAFENSLILFNLRGTTVSISEENILSIEDTEIDNELKYMVESLAQSYMSEMESIQNIINSKSKRKDIKKQIKLYLSK